MKEKDTRNSPSSRTPAKFSIRVVPNSSRQKAVSEQGRLKVYVNAPAIEGRANDAVIDVLADHFKVKRRQVRICSGARSRDKTVEISPE